MKMKCTKRQIVCLFGCSVLIMAVMTSCASLEDASQVRHEHIASMNEMMAERSAWLEEPRDLPDCLAFALQNNYTLRLKALERRLAELDVSMSLASFLPEVTATCNYHQWRTVPTAAGFPTAGRHYFKGEFQAGLPIFYPAIWLLYANRKLDRENAMLTQHIARQGIVAQVTTLYYLCLVGELKLQTLQNQIAATKSQFERVSGLTEEGQVKAWECTLAETQYKSKEIEYSQAQRDLAVTRGELLQALGLPASEAARLQLKYPTEPKAVPEIPAEQSVLKALTLRPELTMADRSMVIAENNVRMAIADFLPKITSFLNYSWTTDEIADQANNLLGGIAGSMDLFSGFSKVSQYKGAKIGKEAAGLQREAMFLSIMLEVVKADSELKKAAENYTLAQLAFSAAQARYEEMQGRYNEGLVPLYEMLDARAEMDEAQLNMVIQQFVQDINMTNLELAMGTLQPDEKFLTPEDIKYPVKEDGDNLLIKE